MKRKVIVAVLISAMTLISASSAAAQSDVLDTLDIERVAIEAINNSQSVKSYDKKADLARQQYGSSQNAAQNSITNGRSAQAVMSGIVGKIQAESTYNQFLASKDINRTNVRLDGYSKYIALLKANYNADIQKKLMDNLALDYKKSQLQLNNGLISQSDARLVEINYNKAVYQYNALQKKLDSAYFSVNDLIGTGIDRRYKTLIDKNIVPAKEVKTVNEYIQSALANRSEIVNAASSLEASKKAFQYGKAILRTDYQSYMLQTQYAIDNSENSLEESKISIQKEIINGYKDLESKMKAMDSQQANYNLADANYKAAQIQYNNSMITLEDFENANIAKAQADMNLKNAQLDAWLAQIKMDCASGVGPALK